MIGTKETLIKILEKADDEDIFELIKKREKSIRSLAQNKYYWSVVVATIWDFHGYTPVETHEILKLSFKLDTTTDLAVDEFKFLIDIIRDIWSTKYDCHIPLPSDLTWEDSLYTSLWF